MTTKRKSKVFSNAKPAHRRNAKPKPSSKIEAQTEWQGVKLSVSYEADWLSMAKQLSRFATAHLEVRVISPEEAMLPITDTGYRSHFVSRAEIEVAGGPVAFVKTWLDHEAKAPEWKRRQTASRQLCLF